MNNNFARGTDNSSRRLTIDKSVVLTNKQSENSFFGAMFSDFGGSKMPRKDTFVGTRDYISPEMAKESLSGPFSDIWALGIITFELFEGKRPWTS